MTTATFRLPNVRVAARLSATQATILLAWATLFAFVTAPPADFFGVAPGLGWGDLLWMAMLPFFLYLVVFRGFRRAHDVPLVIASFAYTGLILILPLVGLLLFPLASLSWVFGDYRWVQLLVVAAALWVAYRGADLQAIERHFVAFLVLLLLLQWVGLFSQVAVQVFGLAPGRVLEVWYPGGGDGYGLYGHHIGRYASLLDSAGPFSFVGGVAFFLGLLLGFHRSWVNGFMFISGVVFVVAAGTRTMMFGAPVVALVILLALVASRGAIGYRALLSGFLVVALSPFFFYFLYYFNIGRIASSDRLRSVWEWVTGQATFNDISGRGGDLWLRPIEEAQSEWSAIGTLVNPGHALDHLPAFDSYWVFMVAQAGPFLVLPFLALMALLSLRGWGLLRLGYFSGAVAVAVSMAILLSSITQNTMTGMPARVFLGIAILIVLMTGVSRRGQARGGAVQNGNLTGRK